MNIKVRMTKKGYQAFFESDPQKRGWGKTADEALGNLTITYSMDLNLKIEYDKDDFYTNRCLYHGIINEKTFSQKGKIHD